MMNLKNKTLALVVASALVMPSALAVEGSDGMHYTSASEGFYSSIRVRFHSGGSDGDNAAIENSSSRLGIQGTSEMSHGLEGFYRYETAFDINNGDQGFGTTRLAYVGLRGGFGSVRVGSDWADDYNFVTGSTDIANVNSGNFNYNDDYAGRASQAIHYMSPDFNGLQVAARFELDGGNDTKAGPPTCANNDLRETSDGGYFCADGSALGDPDPATATDTNDSELDGWNMSAKYEFSGFTVAGSYTNRPDYRNDKGPFSSNNDMAGMDAGLEDRTAWALRGSYGQDNWGVSTWYGQNNASDYGYYADDMGMMKAKDDETVFSIAGNVAVGPTGIYVVHETMENYRGRDDASTAFGVEYNFNSKAKTWIEYAARQFDTAPEKEDYVTIGLRHDF